MTTLTQNVLVRIWTNGFQLDIHRWSAVESEEALSLGAGFKYSIPGMGALCIDYAFHNFGILKDVQMFSVGIEF
jgi:hypothetical protein